MSGQTLTDRIAAAQYQLTGSEVSRAVCKATTHEVMAPKKKHLEYLISATNATNVNIPQMADTLFERATNASWIVVFKALVTTHHMCVHGNERFIQYLASRTALFNLSNFIDKTGSNGYDMSTFIRRYGRYLNERAFAYRQMAFDFTKVKKGAEGVMRTMTPEKLLKGMPVLQTQIDTLLEFDVHPKELNNPIINAGFLLLFKDLVKLFASYNDGVINLLEKYFKMKKSDCKEALEIYKRFLTRVTKIGEFMKLAETVGVDKNDIPDINYAPSSILESLETHMNSLEGKKGSPTKGSPTNNVSPTSTPAKSAAAVPTIAPPPEEATDSLLDLDPLSSSGPSVGASAAPTSWGDLLGSEMGESMLPDSTLAVEPVPSAAGVTSTPAAAEPGVSLAPPPSAAAAPTPGATNMDLLGDAFSTPVPTSDASAEGGAPASTPTPAADAAADAFAPSGGSSDAVGPGLDLFAMMPMENNCFNSVAPPSAPSSTITAPIPPPPPSIDLLSAMFDSRPDPSFTKADLAPSVDMFGADSFSSPTPLSSAPPMDKGVIMDLFGDSTGGETKPAAPAAASGAELMAAFDGLGDVLMPSMTPQAGAASSPVKPMGGDLDATMASMASNLGMGSQKPGENTMGGWSTPQVAPPSWGAPMNVPMGSPSFMGSNQGFSMGGAVGAGAPMMPMVRPGFGAPATPGAPMGSPGMAGSPRRPPPPKNALDDLNIKDFM
ncbi:clathrin coat assembly protein AP180 isoform X2 [Salmo salar]|uniref:Clathrin coat assembly protein AP180 n=1 Tax=Salmo salar TaxID=8030 RepID=A0A1S3S999_SALSA|nr:clathrin coat assembly protein AP180-like isoform X2 [Salmo salar]|eukprot:XP_014060918.1 PREDICTED: clathrin coat assembly protein AP180-like isoform X2 [Salmo salar]